MSLTHITDHIAQAQARLPLQDKPRAGINAKLAIWGTGFQSVEDALWQLFTQRTLAVAVGAQLDVLGRILDEARNGATDAVYRLVLQVKISVLHSSGTAAQLIHIFKLLLPSNNIYFSALGGASFQLELGFIDTANLALHTHFLNLAKSAGINGQAHWSDTTLPADMFTFAPTSAEVSSTHLGFGDANAPGTGGHLSGVIV